MERDDIPVARQQKFSESYWSKSDSSSSVVATSTLTPTDELEWLLDLPVWATNPPHKNFDLTPWEVMEDLDKYPEHARRIATADLDSPIDLIQNGRGEWVLNDGYYQLAKAIMMGQDQISARFLLKR